MNQPKKDWYEDKTGHPRSRPCGWVDWDQMRQVGMSPVTDPKASNYGQMIPVLAIGECKYGETCDCEDARRPRPSDNTITLRENGLDAPGPGMPQWAITSTIPQNPT